MTSLKLDPKIDYFVQLPLSDGTLNAGVSIVGGHNVIVRPGVIHVPPQDPVKDPQLNRSRGLILKDQTGTIYVKDVKLMGQLSEGIDLSETRGATVVLVNIESGTVTGYSTHHHPDLLQVWAGPAALYVDGFTGTTTYQGMFLTPNQRWSGPPPRLVYLRDVRIDARDGAYALWREGSWPLTVIDVSVLPSSSNRDAWLWPKPSTGNRSWAAVAAVR